MQRFWARFVLDFFVGAPNEEWKDQPQFGSCAQPIGDLGGGAYLIDYLGGGA
ncbi:hypothetical protein GCM10025785_12630 [Corynebacterium canis]